ncbi:MAG: tyrosine-type recombinase/integrase [Desulfomonilaceae bacterium]
MASILKRPGPKGKTVWQAQVRKKGYPAQIKTFDRKTDAQKWAKKTEHQMEAGLWKDSKEASQITLSQALDRYLAAVTPRKRPKTQKSENLSATYLKKSMGKLSLLQITPEKVASYRDKRLEHVSANSVRIELALLSNLFVIAQKEWSFHGLDNPVRKVNRPKIPEGRCPVLSEEQIRRLLEECRKATTKLLYPFVLLALHTGCRSMELRGLRWSQVDLEGNFISLVGTETKTHRARAIPLSLAAGDILRELAEDQKIKKVVDLSGQRVGLVFPARRDSSKPRDMHMSFDRALKRAGLNKLPGLGKLRIHDLRHLCGTFLVMSGVDLETIRAILGHRDLATTQRYLHVVDAHKRKAISKIGHLGMAAKANE